MSQRYSENETRRLVSGWVESGEGTAVSDQFPPHAGVDFVHDLAAADGGDGPPFSGKPALFHEPEGVAAAEGFRFRFCGEGSIGERVAGERCGG